MIPRATYRLQFHSGFTFDDAAALAPYLAQLGVSHVYASPFLKAHPGSTHGYDVVDYTELNPELGGPDGYRRMSDALAAQGLRQIIDVVPNHMGVGGADNALWLDLLEWGEEADHAGWFDVDWSPDRNDIRNKVLVPFLGEQYGEVLEKGQLVLKFDGGDGSFAVWAHDTHKLPVCPLDYEQILGIGNTPIADLGDAFADLMRWRPQIMRRTRDLKAQLAQCARNDPAARAYIEERLSLINGQVGDLSSWSALDALIGRQRWKPAHFLVASDDINYRRFFNIATLAGIRMELPDVFDEAHRLVFGLIANGIVDGLRIDHIDGLFDPKGYLVRLREQIPTQADGSPAILLVEKILGAGEALRADWPIDGTTGYDFTNLLTGLFVRPDHEGAFSRLYRSFTGETRAFDALVETSKLQIIDDEMSSELHRVARAATRVARQNPRTADFTLTVLQRALRLIVAAFPVYRTYVDGEDKPGAVELRQIEAAIGRARAMDPAIDPTVFGFLRRLLSGALAGEAAQGYRRSDVFRCAMKIQQYCGPVMAKGVEDTAFYRYNRFVALNEVGGSPDRFGVTVDAFHEANRVRAERWPGAMLATSTHDTKRGEDTRARLVALSCVPDDWDRSIKAWNEILQLSSALTDSPDRNDRYLLFQLLVGTWPAALVGDGPISPTTRDDYIERLKGVMTKSLREAKTHSTWTAPNEDYEAATMRLIEEALRGAGASRFLDEFRPFANRIAELGAQNTFAQTVLKFTVPGLPDIYQGSDMWDLTMVDPDNRRPIDYDARRRALDTIGPDSSRDVLRRLWTNWRDGQFKLALTAGLLALRRREPWLFAAGDYGPIDLTGSRIAALCAFARQSPGLSLVVVAKRFPTDAISADAMLVLPSEVVGREAVSLLSGSAVTLRERTAAKLMLDDYPAGVWLVRTV